MTYRVRLLPPARNDLIRVSEFLADAAPQSALRAAGVLDHALKSLETFPERAPRNDVESRDLIVPFGQAGYVVRYRVQGSEVVIQRIFHTREDR